MFPVKPMMSKAKMSPAAQGIRRLRLKSVFIEENLLNSFDS